MLTKPRGSIRLLTAGTANKFGLYPRYRRRGSGIKHIFGQYKSRLTRQG